MKEKIIYVKRQEDLASVVEKIIISPQDELILVIPKNSKISERRLNIKILRREAEYSKKKIYLDSEDERIRQFAKEEDIPLVDDYSRFFKPVRRRKRRMLADIIAPKEEKEKEFSVPLEVEKTEEIEKSEKISLEEEKGLEREGEESEKKEDFAETQREEPKKEPEKEEIDFWQMLAEKNKKKEKEEEFLEEKKDFSEMLSRKQGINKRKVVFLFSLFAFFFLFYLIVFALPKATITLNTQKVEKEIERQVEFDQGDNVNFEKNILPAKLLVFKRETTKKFSTTGTKKVETKAHGIIRIFNAYSSEPQVLIATTRFLSSSGKLFRLPRRIVVPGAKVIGGKISPSYIDVEVYADQPGEEYNIGPDKFTIPAFKENNSPRYYGFYAQSFKPMEEGYKGEVRVVSKEDIETAKEKVKKNIEFILEKEFKEKVPENYLFFENGWQVKEDSLEADAKEEEKREEFNIKGSFTLKGIIVPKDIFLNFVQNLLKKEGLDKKWEVIEAKGEIKNLSFKKESKDKEEKEIASGSLIVKLSLKKKIDKEEIKKEILGKKIKETKEILKKEKGINSVEISLRPFWLRVIPPKEKKVEIIVR